METRFTSQAMRAYIEQSRGALPSMLSTDAAMADWVADSNMRRVDGQFASFTLELHGPVQWLEPTALEASDWSDALSLLGEEGDDSWQEIVDTTC
jgi:hypothetical protein